MALPKASLDPETGLRRRAPRGDPITAASTEVLASTTEVLASHLITTGGILDAASLTSGSNLGPKAGLD